MWVNEGRAYTYMYHIVGKFGGRIKYGIWQIPTNSCSSSVEYCIFVKQ